MKRLWLILFVIGSVSGQDISKPNPYIGTKSCKGYYSWDEGDIKEKQIETTIYYTNGNVKEEARYSNHSEEYEFIINDSTGKLISKTIYNSIIDEDLFWKYPREYSGGDIKEIWEYSYNDDKRLINIMIRDTLGAITGKHIFDYSSKDGYDYSETFVYGNNDSLLERTTVREKYDANGNLSESYEKLPLFGKIYEINKKFFYNIKGDLIRVDNVDGGTVSGATYYEYNEDGYLIEEFVSPGAGPSKTKRDKRNRIIEEAWIDAGIHKITYIYEDY